MTLKEWAAKWNISPEALSDLQAMIVPPVTQSKGKMSESAVQQRVRLEAAKRGIRLFRNNVGACQDTNGNFIRYGLANDSKQMNDKFKSADLIGITPTVVTTEMVGSIVGIFTSIEVKKQGWKFTGSKREVAQRDWAAFIIANGGLAKMISSEDEL